MSQAIKQRSLDVRNYEASNHEIHLSNAVLNMLTTVALIMTGIYK